MTTPTETPRQTSEADASAQKPEEPWRLIMEALVTKEWKVAEEVLRKNIPLALQKQWENSGLEDYNPILFLDHFRRQ